MLIKVSVTAGARRERIEKKADDRYEVAVREKAEANAANRRVAEVLARELGCDGKRIRMIKGHHSPSKTFFIPDAAL